MDNGMMFDVTAFGAVGDAKTLNTEAIQRAVDACADAGGGRVVLPGGTFVSGSIFLRSPVEFHLDAGAVLQGSRNMDDYPCPTMESFGYRIFDTHAGLITGHGLTDVSITGPGTVDGQGQDWWRAKDAGTLKHGRPHIIFLFDCERVTIDGVNLMNSPTWTVKPLICRNLTINNVSVKNPWRAYHNCDGINPTSCRNVRISNCHLDTGDDAITIKTISNLRQNAVFIGNKPPAPIPCENIVIENCIIEHAHSGVGIGAEVIGGIQNILVTNCVFDGTRAGIRIYRYPEPGGHVKDVRINNIVMRKVEWVFEFSTYFEPARITPGPDPETTPEFSNIHFSNITATQAHIACELRGLPKMPIHEVSFSNMRIQSNLGFNLRDVRNVLLDNVTVESCGVPLISQAVTGLELRRFNGPTPCQELPVIQIERTRDAWIHGSTAAPGTHVFLGLVGDENTVTLGANRLEKAAHVQVAVTPANEWSIFSHAFIGSGVNRETGSKNAWLPVTDKVMETLRRLWTRDQIDKVFSISRVEPNSRQGAEVGDPDECRLIFIIEAKDVAERLVIFDDGEVLSIVNDPNFQACGPVI